MIMDTLLAFAPFIAFVIFERLTGATWGLIAGAVVSLSLVLREWLIRRRSAKIIEVGSVLLFGGLAAYSRFTEEEWSIAGIRLCVDTGLLIIVLISLLIRSPFTLQYAREKVPQPLWESPTFIRTNYVITTVWALAFAVMAGADLLLLYVPSLPAKVGIGLTILAIVCAIRFTAWYPAQQQARAYRSLSRDSWSNPSGRTKQGS
jgi:hypothetical protein